MSSSLILGPQRRWRGAGRWWPALRAALHRLVRRPLLCDVPDALAALDARTLRDIGAPPAWQQAARERDERHAQALSLDALRARGGLGA